MQIGNEVLDIGIILMPLVLSQSYGLVCASVKCFSEVVLSELLAEMKPKLCRASFYCEIKCEICCSLLCPLTL